MPGLRYLMCESGACIHDARTGRDLRHEIIPRPVAARVIEIVRSFDLLAQMFIENQSYMRCAPGASIAAYHAETFRGVFESGSLWREDLFEWFLAGSAEVSKFNLYLACEEDRAQVRAALRGLGLMIVDTTGLGLELSSGTSTKGRALRQLCALLNIPAERVMAVGDSDNDVDMLQMAGLAVAMGNAVPGARRRRRHHHRRLRPRRRRARHRALSRRIARARRPGLHVSTSSRDHDGVGHAIGRYLGV